MQGSNQIQDFLDIVRRRAWQIVLPALVGLALGNAVATLVPRRYSTSTQLELRETSLPSAGEGMVAQTLMKDVESAAIHIKAVDRVRRVIEKLEWQDFTSLTTPLQQDYLRDVLLRIKVKPTVARRGGSSFITIGYSDTDPERAEQFVNKLRDAYTSEVVERFRNDQRAIRDTLQNQAALAQESYLDKEKQASELRRKHGLSNTQEGRGKGVAEDPIFTQLSTAREELTNTILRLETESVRLTTLEQQYAEAPREVPQETTGSALGVEHELAQIEAEIRKWEDEKIGLRPAHSNYRRAEDEIVKLQERFDSIVQRATRPVQEKVVLVINPKREQLRSQIDATNLAIAQLEAQKQQLTKTVTELSEQHADRSAVYRELQQLDNEVARHQTKYNNLAQRFDSQEAFVELISQQHANPFIVSEQATTPTEHTSPNELLLLAVGLLLGLGLGLLLAVAGEFGHNGYRSVADIGRSLAVPVLGVVNAIVTREESRQVGARKLMISTSTVVLVAAILFITYAYENRPSLLGPELTGFIDDLRQMFR